MRINIRNRSDEHIFVVMGMNDRGMGGNRNIPHAILSLTAVDHPSKKLLKIRRQLFALSR